ncbi:hypothetical protein ABTZ58_03910 [Streptomyces sp. NPDC094143]|uniref:hypothetical protein n=1 Tax=Streptomyces sp. NPDC094143 TaxID=3155310 RepID=UPI003331EB51
MQLLKEFGDLPPLYWQVSNHERYRGDLYGFASLPDPRPVMAVWAEALGATVTQSQFPYTNDEVYAQFAVETLWRDVRVRIVMSCPAAVLASETAVAA